MKRDLRIAAPIFEIGPKNYLFGKEVVELARIADELARKYAVSIIYTAPYANIAEVSACTRSLFVIAPHMDPLPAGRGLADILPESLKAAGAKGVMLNHAEKPLSLATLRSTLRRAEALDMATLVCADAVDEAVAAAALDPDLIVCEPTDLIGTGTAAGAAYARQVFDAIVTVKPHIGVMVGGGIKCGRDVYDVIFAGADGTGSSSGILLAKDPAAMAEEMIRAVHEAWKDRQGLGRNGNHKQALDHKHTQKGRA